MTETDFLQNEPNRTVTLRRSPDSRRDDVFFGAMALASALTVFGGFARTYYLKAWTGTTALQPLVHVHAIVFTAWIMLFVTQTLLVAKNRTDLHKRLGAIGGVLAVVMVVLGYLTSIAARTTRLHRPISRGTVGIRRLAGLPCPRIGRYASLCHFRRGRTLHPHAARRP